MPDNISSEAKEVVYSSIDAFTNLLKEFPKEEAGDFVYDESTLKKIGNAADLLSRVTALSETGSEPLKDSFKKLSLLLEELPKDSSDEFLYDREIHRYVVDARGVLADLNQIIS